MLAAPSSKPVSLRRLEVVTIPRSDVFVMWNLFRGWKESLSHRPYICTNFFVVGISVTVL